MFVETYLGMLWSRPQALSFIFDQKQTYSESIFLWQKSFCWQTAAEDTALGLMMTSANDKWAEEVLLIVFILNS